jgi:Nucleotidyltransferase domain
MLIYGSKARGQAHAESDVDVLLIVKNGAGPLKKETAAYWLLAGRYLGCIAIYSRLHPRGVGEPEKKRLGLPSGG